MNPRPRIKAIRKEKGLMQWFCAKNAGILQQQWSDFERGVKYPRIDKAYKMADALGVEIQELYER